MCTAALCRTADVLSGLNQQPAMRMISIERLDVTFGSRKSHDVADVFKWQIERSAS
jgi:hypothetical protein